MIYIWLDENSNVKSYGETPFVLPNNHTQETFDGTMEDYSNRLRMEASKMTISADDLDETIVTIYSDTSENPITVMVDDLPIDVTMINGVGTLPAISSNIAGTIGIYVADQTKFCIAGAGSLTITAIEVL